MKKVMAWHCRKGKRLQIGLLLEGGTQKRPKAVGGTEKPIHQEIRTHLKDKLKLED
jgi:hypothetical protein